MFQLTFNGSIESWDHALHADMRYQFIRRRDPT